MAIQLARHHTGRDVIVVVDAAYHGGLLYFGHGGEALLAPFDFRRITYNDVDGLTDVIDDRVAAVLVEPMMGAAGCIPATPAFLTALRSALRHDRSAADLRRGDDVADERRRRPGADGRDPRPHDARQVPRGRDDVRRVRRPRRRDGRLRPGPRRHAHARRDVQQQRGDDGRRGGGARRAARRRSCSTTCSSAARRCAAGSPTCSTDRRCRCACRGMGSLMTIHTVAGPVQSASRPRRRRSGAQGAAVPRARRRVDLPRRPGLHRDCRRRSTTPTATASSTPWRTPPNRSPASRRELTPNAPRDRRALLRRSTGATRCDRAVVDQLVEVDHPHVGAELDIDRSRRHLEADVGPGDEREHTPVGGRLPDQYVGAVVHPHDVAGDGDQQQRPRDPPRPTREARRSGRGRTPASAPRSSPPCTGSAATPPASTPNTSRRVPMPAYITSDRRQHGDDRRPAVGAGARPGGHRRRRARTPARPADRCPTCCRTSPRARARRS